MSILDEIEAEATEQFELSPAAKRAIEVMIVSTVSTILESVVQAIHTTNARIIEGSLPCEAGSDHEYPR